MEFISTIQEAIDKLSTLKTGLKPLDSHQEKALQLFESHLISNGLSISAILAEAAIISSKKDLAIGPRNQRNNLEFIVPKNRSEDTLVYSQSPSFKLVINLEKMKKCIEEANFVLERIHDLSLVYGVEVFELLGLRNLSAFVGQVMVKVFKRNHDDVLMENPNQDGYPDLCALTPDGKKYILEKATNPDGTIRPDKELWSPYPYGGLEIKATCGNTPSASKIPKPLIGEPRYPILVSAEWKAHHQETKVLLGLFWDFIDGLPTILAAFFRNDLDTTVGNNNKDWGGIIHPKEGGGRTTSVSIMKKGKTILEGVKKMGAGCLVLPIQKELLYSICRVFYIKPETIGFGSS